MATNQDAPGEDVKTQNDASGKDVKTDVSKKTDDEVNTNHQDHSSKGDVKPENKTDVHANQVPKPPDDDGMSTYGGLPIAKTLLEDIKKNTIEEFKRKYHQELEESGRLLTDEQKKIIEQYHLVMKPLGEALKPGQTLQPSEIDKIINDRIAGHTEAIKSELGKERAEKENALMQLLNKNKELENNKIEKRVSDGLLKHPNFNKKHLKRAILNVMNDGVIKIDDVTQEPIVITSDGARGHNPMTNKPWAVEDYIEKQWLSENEIFLKYEDNSTVGKGLGNEPGSGSPKIGFDESTPKISVDRSNAVPSSRR